MNSIFDMTPNILKIDPDSTYFSYLPLEDSVPEITPILSVVTNPNPDGGCMWNEDNMLVMLKLDESGPTADNDNEPYVYFFEVDGDFDSSLLKCGLVNDFKDSYDFYVEYNGSRVPRQYVGELFEPLAA